MKCTFCGEIADKGKGKIYVKKDGKILQFCSSKCEKNMIKFKRNPVSVKWTKRYKKQ